MRGRQPQKKAPQKCCENTCQSVVSALNGNRNCHLTHWKGLTAKCTPFNMTVTDWQNNSRVSWSRKDSYSSKNFFPICCKIRLIYFRGLNFILTNKTTTTKKPTNNNNEKVYKNTQLFFFKYRTLFFQLFYFEKACSMKN